MRLINKGITCFPRGCEHNTAAPITTSMIKPMDDKYKFRSATTNPTRKKIFIAGRKGITRKAKDIARHLNLKQRNVIL